MVAIIALLMVAGFYLLFTNVKTSFNETATCVTGVPTNAAANGC
jgi:Flp pilus assembly pilin Flp